MRSPNPTAFVVEFIVTFLFIFAGVGSAMTTEKLVGNEVVGLFFVAMAHAFVVVVMISAGFRISGDHLNPAVTLGLCVGGHITVVRSVLYWIDQIACFGSRLCPPKLPHWWTGKFKLEIVVLEVYCCASCSKTYTFVNFQPTPIHTLTAGMDSLQGVIMEIVLTFSLLFIVYATLVDPKKGFLDGLGPLLTGLVVGANIMAAGAFSGASMNPARSFGPALVAGDWTDHWVYWVGPLIGGGLAGFIYENFFIVRTHVLIGNDEF